uniref:Malate dehydrogenase n=2 Tax=Globodera pallida TaxID=36090 RepID=A0A183CTE2_GLOPA
MFSRRNADDPAVVMVSDVAAKDAVVKSAGFIVELDVVLAGTTGTVLEAVVASGVGGGTVEVVVDVVASGVDGLESILNN